MTTYSDFPATGPHTRRTESDAPEITVADILRILSAHRRLLVALPLAMAVVFAVWSMSQPRTYTATAAFAAHGGGGSAPGLSGIAAQLGIGVASASSETPAYYAEVITSSAVLGPIADSSVTLDNRRATLPQILGVDETDPERRRGLTAEALRRMIVVRPSRETGIIRVGVTGRDPQVAALIAGHLLAQVNEFNLKQRQTQATKEREFAQRQLASARGESNAAQQQLAAFLQRNRQYENSPSLVVEYERLQRAVSEKQGVVGNLLQAFDQARLEEVRNVPRIVVLEPAASPLRGNSRGTVKKAAAGFVLGMVIAIGIAFIQQYRRATALAESLPRR
jgi:uncharacterized protein involved in exopolysaccharide biosynthesis